MVESLIRVTPSFAKLADQVFSPEKQSETATLFFEQLKAEWLSVKRSTLSDSEKGKPYFATNRRFSRLISERYYRTNCPRLTTKGSTFHGMKKTLLLPLLASLSVSGNAVFIDLDMTAAHSQVARFLLNKWNSLLSQSLKNPHFWQAQVNDAKPYFERNGITLSDKEIKKLLKVGLYTSLNGGNPVSEDRLVSNLSLNLENYLNNHNILSKQDLLASSVYVSTRECLNAFQLVQEVKSLNSRCAKSMPLNVDKYVTYTVDRVEPYRIDKKHLGISRVLQGFEVVLLTVLARETLLANAIPVSLDHDGLLAMISLDTFKKLYSGNPEAMAEKITNSGFKDWSTYLLEEPVPIEVKRLVREGKITEY